MKSSPVYISNACVLLSLDIASTTGWCIYTGSVVLAHGTVRPQREEAQVASIVAQALTIVKERKLPLVVVRETWGRGGRLSPVVLESLGVSWGAWKAALRRAKHPARLVVKVHCASWTSAILSLGWAVTTEQRQAASIARVKAQFGLSVSHDEAAAICMALWAQHAGEVAQSLAPRKKLLPKAG